MPFDAEGELEREGVVARPRRRRLLCAECRAPVTTDELRCEVTGESEHVFMNPSGMVFHIACFREASGAIAAGSATHDFSWFPGFAWRFALCRACHVHLGWRYTGAGEPFWGLVLDRLLPADETTPRSDA